MSFSKVKDPPPFQFEISKPRYHTVRGTVFILNNHGSNRGLLEYNLNKQLIVEKYDTPHDIILSNTGHCIDTHKNIV